MESKHVTGILAGIAVILAGVTIALSVGQDKEPPVISVGEEKISYVEGNDKKELLQGISAEDNKDGDLSEDIFIERIIDLKDGRADVIYAVVDENKNVGKAHRIVEYTVKEEQVQPVPEKENQPTEEKKKEVVQSGKNPAIWLKSNTVVIKQGERFNPLSYIQDVKDDKDKKSDLDRRISIEGSYDINKKGEYALKYFVMDSDGNQSNVEEFVLVVQ